MDIDLSHLTEEERKQIEAVMKRQKDEEDKEAKIKRVLEDDLEHYTQAVHQVSKEAKERGLNSNGAYCQICHKVKFADGVGHSCNYCQTKSCARCGGKVTLRSNKPSSEQEIIQVLWVCNICRKKQTLLTKTGQWFQTPPPKTPPIEKSVDGVTTKPRKEGEPPQEKKQRLQDNTRGTTSSDKENVPGGRQTNHPTVTRTGSYIHRQYSMSNDDDVQQNSSRRDSHGLRGKAGDRRYDSAGDIPHLERERYKDKEHYLDSELYPANKDQRYPEKDKRGNECGGENFERHAEKMTYQEPRRHSDQDRYRENFRDDRFPDDQFLEQIHYQNQPRIRSHRDHRYTYTDGSGNITPINDRSEERASRTGHRGERHGPPPSEKGQHPPGHPPRERTPVGIPRSPAPDRKKYGERHLPKVASAADGGNYRTPTRMSSSPQHPNTIDPVIDIQNSNEAQERNNDNVPKQHLDPSSAFKRSSNKQKESMIRNDSLSSDQSEHVRPPPPKPHKKTKGTRKQRQTSSPSSSDEEIRSTPDCTSCDDVESESVSEKGEVDSLEDNWQSNTSEQKTNVTHPVTWQRDMDNNRLIGRMILKKSQSDGSLKEDSSAILGLKVGRDRGKLGPLISKIRQGSIADTVGQLKEGDEVLEWNGQPLQGKDFSEVHDIINRSKREPQVQLVVARAMGSDGRSASEKSHQIRSRPDITNKRSSQSSGYESASRSSKEEPQPIKRPSVTVTSPGSPSSTQLTSASPYGDLQLKLAYDSQSQQVFVTIISAQNLPPRDNKEARYPYVKMYLLPTRRENSKRKTQIFHKMCDPKWNQQFVYSPIRRSDMKMRTLEMTVWDSNQTAKELIGQVLINLHTAIFDNEPHWYPLSLPDISHGPLPQPSPVPPDQPGHVQDPRRGSRDSESRVNTYPMDCGGGPVRRTNSGGPSYATYPNTGPQGAPPAHYPQDEGYRPQSQHRHLPSVEQYSNDPANHYPKVLHGKHPRDIQQQPQRQMPRYPHRDPSGGRDISPQIHKDTLHGQDNRLSGPSSSEIHGSFTHLPTFRDHPRDIHRDLPQQPRRNSAGSHNSMGNRIEDKQHGLPNHSQDRGSMPRQGRPTNQSQLPNQVPLLNQGQMPYSQAGQSYQPSPGKPDLTANQRSSYPPSQGKPDQSANQRSGYPPPQGKPDPIANQRSGYPSPPGPPDQSANQRSGYLPSQGKPDPTANPRSGYPPTQGKPDQSTNQRSGLMSAAAQEGLGSLPGDKDPATQLPVPNNGGRLPRDPSPSRERRPGIMGEYTLPPRRRDSSPSRDPNAQDYPSSRMQEYPAHHQQRRSYSLERQDEGRLDYNPSGEPLRPLDFSPPRERQPRRDMLPGMDQPRHRSYSPGGVDSPQRHRDYSPSRQGLMEPPKDRRHRDPSPSRDGRRREPSPSRDGRRREPSPRPFDYDHIDSRRSRSPNRRANGYFPEGERRSQSEVREYSYDRPYRHMNESRIRHEGSSLPGSPIRMTMARGQIGRVSPRGSPRASPRTSPTSSPTGQKRSRQLPQVPSHVMGRSERDSNMSTLSDMSALTSASTMSVLSTQSERPRGGRKLSDLKAKMEERSPYPKKQNLIRSTSSAEVYTYERTDGSISDSAADTGSMADLKKRRTSLSKVAAFVGLSKKSSSTSNLAGKKRSTIQRSEEVGIGVDMKRGLTAQASRESTDGSVCSIGSTESTNTVWMPRMVGNEAHFNDFLDGLGPSQLVGRQVLGTPALGDIQLSLQEKNGQLLVEVIQARSLVAKPSAKIVPAPWVKLYLMDGNRCIGKRKTKIARRTLNPEYRQSLLFDEDYRGKVLRITVWGDYARIDKKDFLGLAEILLDNMSLMKKVTGWYKLFNHASLADIPPRSTAPSLDGSVTSLSSFKTF